MTVHEVVLVVRILAVHVHYTTAKQASNYLKIRQNETAAVKSCHKHLSYQSQCLPASLPLLGNRCRGQAGGGGSDIGSATERRSLL